MRKLESSSLTKEVQGELPQANCLFGIFCLQNSIVYFRYKSSTVHTTIPDIHLRTIRSQAPLVGQLSGPTWLLPASAPPAPASK